MGRVSSGDVYKLWFMWGLRASHEVFSTLSLRMFTALSTGSGDCFRVARGYRDLHESFALVEVKGRRAVTPILISRELSETLIGVITLEALGLTVDPTTGELKEVEILLL
jgi:hypothetical protein